MCDPCRLRVDEFVQFVRLDRHAIGVILMVLTSLYMGWQRLRVHPVGSMVSFVLGILATMYFMWGLAWLG